MIKTNGEKDLVIPVSECFWPTFLTSKLVVKPVKHAWCFCLNDEALAKQMILVYPTDDSIDIPMPQDLAAVFKLGKKGQPFFEVRDVPIPLQRLIGISGVYLEQVFLDDREMIILYANRQSPADIAFADSMLVGLHLQTERKGEQPWPQGSQEMYVLFSEFFRFFDTVNVFALVRCGVEIVVTPRMSIITALEEDGAKVYRMQKPPEQEQLLH